MDNLVCFFLMTGRWVDLGHTPLSLIRGPILLDYRCPLLCGDFRAVSSAMVGQPVDIRDDICPEQNKKA